MFPFEPPLATEAGGGEGAVEPIPLRFCGCRVSSFPRFCGVGLQFLAGVSSAFETAHLFHFLVGIPSFLEKLSSGNLNMSFSNLPS